MIEKSFHIFSVLTKDTSTRKGIICKFHWSAFCDTNYDYSFHISTLPLSEETWGERSRSCCFLCLFVFSFELVGKELRKAKRANYELQKAHFVTVMLKDDGNPSLNVSSIEECWLALHCSGGVQCNLSCHVLWSTTGCTFSGPLLAAWKCLCMNDTDSNPIEKIEVH